MLKPILAASAFALGGAAAMAVLSPPAFGATIRLYTPGGAPCAGACTLEWAAAEFGVPVGEPTRMVIPAGTMIVKMSYSKDGKPMWLSESAVFADDQPGQGYPVEGTDFWMVQIDECQNWALVVLPRWGFFTPPVSSAPPVYLVSSPPVYLVSSPPPYSPPWTPPWNPPPPCIFCEPPPPCTGCEPPPCCEPPPPPPAVPLPAALWALLTGLGALGGLRVRSWL